MLIPRISRNYSLFDDFFTNDFFNRAFDSTRISSMKTDVSEKDGQYLLQIEMPGYAKEEIHAELKDGYLTIRGNHEQSEEEKDSAGNIIRRERSFGACSRSFYVGDAITQEDIKASYKDGILLISLPKEKEKLPEEKKLIEIL